MMNRVMRILRALWLRLLGLFGSASRDCELSAELESHLQLHMDDNLRAGMTPYQARRDALIKLGGIEQTKQAYRERATLPFMEKLMQDLRFAIRLLRREPSFSLVAVLVLTLGIAASTAIFGFVDAALIKPLPYVEPGRLVVATEQIALQGRANLSYPDYLDWKRRNTVFRSLDVFTSTGYMLNTSGGNVMVPGARVSAGLFRALGITPMLGRDFHAGEDVPGGPQNVIITYAEWQQHFGGRSDIVGHAVTLSGATFTVIGVLPRSFQFALRGRAEFWAPLQAIDECALRRSCHNLNGIARLNDGVSLQQADAQMKAIAAQLERQYPNSNSGQGATVIPLSEAVVGNIRPILLTLLAGSGLLLAIACINVASLLLVRSEGRRREFAVRGALGASRLRLIRQFVTEGALLVAASVALGMATAHGTMQLLSHLVPADMLAAMPFLRGIGLNLHCLLFVLAVSLAGLTLFSLTPVVRMSTSELRLADGSRGSSSITWRRLGSHLVVVELAIAVVLLAGAGLLGKSLYRLLRVDLNFQPDHLATLEVALPQHSYTNDAQIIAISRQLLHRVSALPGVQSASITSILPVNSNDNTDWIRFVGRPYDGKHIEVPLRDVSPNYFNTLHTRLLRGRFFSEDEDGSKPLVVIINNALAKKYFPGEDPIGKQFGGITLDPKSIKQIVGIVDDLKEGSLESDIVPAVYYPFSQDTDSYYSLIVRTSQSEESVLPTLSAAIHQVDPGIGTTGETSMTARINDSQIAYLHRSSAWLVGGFGVLALLLSSVGLYGVIAYSVGQREREIGVRMALGAQRASVYRLILTEAGKLAVWGIAAGTLCSLAATNLLRAMLFGVQPWDISILASVAFLLAVSALLASYVPAHRGASIQPIVALRSE
jgi:macrolide transport system ATP-binding/permease protein